jgi:hypothetical protein
MNDKRVVPYSYMAAMGLFGLMFLIAVCESAPSAPTSALVPPSQKALPSISMVPSLPQVESEAGKQAWQIEFNREQSEALQRSIAEAKEMDTVPMASVSPEQTQIKILQNEVNDLKEQNQIDQWARASDRADEQAEEQAEINLARDRAEADAEAYAAGLGP